MHLPPCCHHIWEWQADTTRPGPTSDFLCTFFEFSVFEILLLSWTLAQCWDYSTLSGFFALVLESDLDPHSCVASMLPTGPSPRSRDDHLEFTKESTEFGAKIHCVLIAPDPSKTCLDMSVVCFLSAHWQVSWRTAAWSWRPSYPSLGIHNGTKDVNISYKQHC